MRIVARIETENGLFDAYMPDRELAAFLPRSILIGSRRKAPISLLNTIEAIVRRMSSGRKVHVWLVGNRRYFSFLTWRTVTFNPCK